MILLFFMAWAQPKPYLVEQTVQEILLAHKEVFSSCSLDNGLHQIHFFVDSTGKAHQTKGPTCFEILSTLVFPAHPTTKRDFIWEVASNNHVLFPQKLIREASLPMMLPGLLSTQKEELLHRIGSVTP